MGIVDAQLWSLAPLVSCDDVCIHALIIPTDLTAVGTPPYSQQHPLAPTTLV